MVTDVLERAAAAAPKAEEEGAEGEEGDDQKSTKPVQETALVPKSKDEVLAKLASSRFLKSKDNSEDLASIVHLLLAVTLF